MAGLRSQEGDIEEEGREGDGYWGWGLGGALDSEVEEAGDDPSVSVHGSEIKV